MIKGMPLQAFQVPQFPQFPGIPRLECWSGEADVGLSPVANVPRRV